MDEERRRPRPGWYVIQVSTGSEDRMCRAITRVCKELDEAAEEGASTVGLKECFSFRFASRKKRMGEWHDINRALLPGYVIADVRDPAMLARALRNLRSFARVVTSGEAYSPLDDDERRWLESQSRVGERVIPLSFGYKEGDALVITSGPLKGNEAMVTRVDRKNCMANVELHVGSITFKTTVGLVVLPGKGTTQVV